MPISHPLITDELAKIAAIHLAASDPRLAPVIERAGICPIRPHSDYYRELVESVIGQQLSVKAAASIRKRFLEHFDDSFPAPSHIIDSDIQTLRSLGLSRAKGLYIQDLAQRVMDGRLDFSDFDTKPSSQIVDELVAVKGIGEWTAHMFLMFCMGRSDVLPHGDLGIRNGIYKLYGLESLPDKATIETIAADNHWAPYQSIASWYIWQSLDNAPLDAAAR